MNLQLSLIKKWFDLTKEGIKPEDYREVSAYWCSRLLLFSGRKESIKFWQYFVDFGYKEQNDNVLNIDKISTFRAFKTNVMTLGYPKSTNSERIVKLEHKGIEIAKGKPEWGAEPDKLYFVIKHGRIIG